MLTRNGIKLAHNYIQRINPIFVKFYKIVSQYHLLVTRRDELTKHYHPSLIVNHYLSHDITCQSTTYHMTFHISQPLVTWHCMSVNHLSHDIACQSTTYHMTLHVSQPLVTWHCKSVNYLSHDIASQLTTCHMTLHVS